MLKVNGFYGHVMRNNFRSLWIFLGFAVAFQILGGVILSLVLLFKDPTKMIFVNPVGYLVDYGVWVGLFSILFFIGNLLLYKKNIGRDLAFRSIGSMANSRLHKIVQDLSITAGVAQPEIALIDSEARNAFVCGLNENSSTLVVTDGLLKSLDDEELAAVVAHEITHIKNGDIRLMAFANIAMSSLMFLEKFNVLKIKGTKTIMFLVLFPPFLILFLSAGFVSGLAITLSKVSRLLIASSREFIADAEAVRLTHNPAALISALQKINGMSEVEGIDPIADAMMIDGATVGEFATHPTIAERIAVLVKHSGGMAYDRRPRKDTRFGSQVRVTPGINSQPAVFGLKTKVEPDTARTVNISNASMSVLDRVNVGNDTNVLGVSSSSKKGFYIALLVIGVAMFFASWILEKQFENVSTQLGKSPVESQSSTGSKQVPNLDNNDGVLGLPAYKVYSGGTSYDLVAIALIAMAFFAYVIIVKTFQRRRENEMKKYKLGDF